MRGCCTIRWGTPLLRKADSPNLALKLSEKSYARANRLTINRVIAT